jgi:hypothetical protein
MCVRCFAVGVEERAQLWKKEHKNKVKDKGKRVLYLN